VTYQWFFNDTPILSQTDTNLVFASVQLTNAGSYRVQVANTVGAVLSDPAILMVLRPPSGLASLIGNGTVRLSFLVLPGRSYQVEYKNRLEDRRDTQPPFSLLLVGDEQLLPRLQMGINAPLLARLSFCLRLQPWTAAELAG
jgi:hypothetical protein